MGVVLLHFCDPEKTAGQDPAANQGNDAVAEERHPAFACVDRAASRACKEGKAAKDDEDCQKRLRETAGRRDQHHAAGRGFHRESSTGNKRFAVPRTCGMQKPVGRTDADERPERRRIAALKRLNAGREQ